MENRNENFSIKEIYYLIKSNFWIFVASCAITASLGLAYAFNTPNEYHRIASILIKDQDANNSISSKVASSMGIGASIFQSNTNINNEIHQMKTTRYMQNVVERLGLQYSYSARYGMTGWLALYNSTPFTAVITNEPKNVSSSTFRIKFRNASDFIITDVTAYIMGEEYEAKGKFEGQVNQKIVTPYGEIVITTNDNFNDETSVGVRHLVSKKSSKSRAKEYLKKLGVSLREKDASVIDISIDDENVERADNILNTLITVYNENVVNQKNELANSTANSINNRLEVITRELESVDATIAEFKSDKLVPDFGAVSTIQLAQNTENNNKILELRNQLSMANYIKDYIDKVDDSKINELLPANTGINNSSIEELISQYNNLVLSKNLLLNNSSEDNPLVEDMIVNIKSLRDVIQISINDLITTIKLQQTNLAKEDTKNRRNLSSTPLQAKELLSIEREQAIKQELFIYLLQRREDNELTQVFNTSNTRVISFADGPDEPSGPGKMVILLLSLVIGAIIPAAVIYTKRALL